MDKKQAAKLTIDQLLKMPMCRCMDMRCSNLHWADLSKKQQEELESRWS